MEGDEQYRWLCRPPKYSNCGGGGGGGGGGVVVVVVVVVVDRH